MSGNKQSAKKKPLTRKNQAVHQGRESLTRRLTEGDLLSEQKPLRRIPVGLSSSSVFPKPIEETFRLAAELGYDGVEVMVSHSQETQNAARLKELSEKYRQPILSLHAPTLFLLQHVWGFNPWMKLIGTCRMAVQLGVPVVVAHPPFRWQGKYAHKFVAGVAKLEADYGVKIAVENMYPWRLGLREAMIYLPDHDPTDEGYANITLDLSHAATAGDDVLKMMEQAGPKLAHLHLADGSGKTTKDEHLAPGEGNQPCAEVLRRLANSGFEGSVVVEVSTHSRSTSSRRTVILKQCLEFARIHLGHRLEQ